MNIEDSVNWYVSIPVTNDKDEFDREFYTGDIVQHWKGGLYEIISFGVNTSDFQPMVIYKSLLTGKIWTRTYKSFIGLLDLKRHPEATQPYRMIKVTLFVENFEDIEEEDGGMEDE